jgi:hypothetical protein
MFSSKFPPWWRPTRMSKSGESSFNMLGGNFDDGGYIHPRSEGCRRMDGSTRYGALVEDQTATTS